VTHNGAMFLRNHRKFPAGTVQFYSDLINNVALVMISFPRGLFTHTHLTVDQLLSVQTDVLERG